MLLTSISTRLKRAFPKFAYRHPVIGLVPERLYYYLDTLWQTRGLPGAVVEVGCHLGGTAATGNRFLRRTGHQRRYVCVDTFDGFVAAHFDHDERIGTPSSLRNAFKGNSRDLVASLLAHYGAPEVELVQGDIATVPEEKLPSEIAVCLHDVDLEVPTYEGLGRVYPRMVPGGVILVDDCPEGTDWAGARPGYKRFVEEKQLPQEYRFGFGIVRIPS